MTTLLLKLIPILKNLIFLLKPNLLFGFLKNPLLFISNTLSLSKWISDQSNNKIFNDYFSLKRDYRKRYDLYKYLNKEFNLNNAEINYFEFGVSDGSSFKWWVNSNSNIESKFYGFDTFTGLPEDWGITFTKGEMSAEIPILKDNRATFTKGLFQETLPDFFKNFKSNKNKRNIFHMDADLFSSTIFSLSMIAPIIKINDIILFDEFNVPNHEFFAYKIFTESFYIKTKLIGAVNNYYQVAMICTEIPKKIIK